MIVDEADVVVEKVEVAEELIVNEPDKAPVMVALVIVALEDTKLVLEILVAERLVEVELVRVPLVELTVPTEKLPVIDPEMFKLVTVALVTVALLAVRLVRSAGPFFKTALFIAGLSLETVPLNCAVPGKVIIGCADAKPAGPCGPTGPCGPGIALSIT